MKITGHCHCGEITFEAEVDPASVTVCHCTDCQTLTGSTFRANIQAPAGHFVLLTGTPKSYIKTGSSGSKRQHSFCGTCGTPIYSAAVENPASYSLRVGTIAERHAFTPRRQIWKSSALPWLGQIASAPAFDKQ